MGILYRLALGVVLAVYGGPLFSDLAGGQPQPEPEKMRWERMQVERAMRLVTVQVNRHADHRDVRQKQSEQNNWPPIQAPSAMGQPFQSGVAHGPKGCRHVLSFFQKVDVRPRPRSD
jgi:hypothetical protein